MMSLTAIHKNYQSRKNDKSLNGNPECDFLNIKSMFLACKAKKGIDEFLDGSSSVSPAFVSALSYEKGEYCYRLWKCSAWLSGRVLRLKTTELGTNCVFEQMSPLCHLSIKAHLCRNIYS